MSVTTYTDSDAARLFGTDASTPPTQASHVEKLSLPVALPQIAAAYEAPFLRAYGDLASSGIRQDDWLRFIDGLNVALSASPPLRVVDATDTSVAATPYNWHLVQSTSQEGSAHTIHKSLTDRYLVQANSTYFEPRGLKVRLLTTAALRRLVHAENVELATLPKPPPPQKTTGQKILRVVKFFPIAGLIIRLLSSDGGKSKSALDTPETRAALRLQLFNGALLPVTPLVPPSTVPKGLSSSPELAAKIKQSTAEVKAAAKNFDQQQLVSIRQGRAPPYSYVEYKARRDTRFARQDGYPASGFPAGVIVERENRRARRSSQQQGVSKGDRLEWLLSDSLLWIVLLNAEQDRGITGIHLIDDLSPERISNEVWRDVIEEETDAAQEAAYFEDELRRGK